jgi:phosphatidylinositol alpha-1,6-mannosyltransferase
MENQNYELSVHLPRHAHTRTIANRRGKRFLPFFLPYAAIIALILIRSHDVLLLGDGVLAIVGYLVKLCYGRRKRVVSILHGLDVTYPMWVYQCLWVKRFLPKLDGLISVGNETIRQGTSLGLPAERFAFIPNGIDAKRLVSGNTRRDLEDILGQDLGGKYLLLTCGRLTARKGVAWFVEKVMPLLDEKVLYIVAGDGPDRENILRAIQEQHLEKRVIVLGMVSDEARNMLLNTCDIFVQPNIKIAGDMEGFGISALEAAACGLPVIASRMEGLQDAIQEGQNGFLVESGNAAAHKERIEFLLSDNAYRRAFGSKARKFTLANFNWDTIAKQYVLAIRDRL